MLSSEFTWTERLELFWSIRGVVFALSCLVLLLAMSQWVVSAPVDDVAATSDLQALTVTYPVDFTITLDVEGLTSSTYKSFLSNFRNKLAAQYSGSVPILPTYGNDPPHLVHVNLTTSGHKVTVAFRHDNLYVRGYLMQTTNQWMEFNVDKIHMVSPTSTFLDFGDKYSDMEAAASVTVTGISYTKEALKNAVATLATSNVKKDRAKSLIIVAQMFSEAARFVEIGNYFGSQLFTGGYLPTWMRQLENDWGKYSNVVQCKYAYANYKFQAVTINNVVYSTADQLRNIFGIMLKEKDILKPATCGFKILQDEDEGEVAVVLSANI